MRTKRKLNRTKKAPVLADTVPTLRQHQELAIRLARMFKCDTARITQPMETMFLVIGTKRSTRTDKKNGRGVWTNERGNEKHFTYVEERVIASGDTAKELTASAKHYKRVCGMTMLGVCGMTMLEYFQTLMHKNSQPEKP